MRESTIEDYLTRRVAEAGGETRKVRWIGRRGAPDRLILLPGRSAWVELKAPGEKPTEAQTREHRRLSASGQRVFVVDSFEMVEAIVGRPW